ncbi:MAG: hypothetical protein ABJA77_10995 [Variovorax sp.]
MKRKILIQNQLQPALRNKKNAPVKATGAFQCFLGWLMGLEQQPSDIDTQRNFSTVDRRVPPLVPLLLWRCKANSNRRLAGFEVVKCIRLLTAEIIYQSVDLAHSRGLPGNAFFFF